LICRPFPRGRTQALRRGHRGKDAAVAAPGHGWPMAAAPPGAMPSLWHAEPRRGTEWWGKSALVTFRRAAQAFRK
jgi:hypothetical protein